MYIVNAWIFYNFANLVVRSKIIYIYPPPPTHTQKHTDLFWLFIFRNEFTSALLNQPDSRKLIIDISLKETILIPTLDFIMKAGVNKISLYSDCVLLSDLTKIEIHTKCKLVPYNTELYTLFK